MTILYQALILVLKFSHVFKLFGGKECADYDGHKVGDGRCIHGSIYPKKAGQRNKKGKQKQSLSGQ
jgi:hypothetical protein